MLNKAYSFPQIPLCVSTENLSKDPNMSTLYFKIAEIKI